MRLHTKFLTAAALVAALGAMTPAGAQSGGGCRLTGVATFKPGLLIANVDTAYTYTLTATLSMCAGSPGSPASGSVSLGTVWTDPATGYTWQEPIGTARGGCGSTTTDAISIARWPDGTVTVIHLQTASALNAVAVTGTVQQSVVLSAVDQQPGQPATLTVGTTRFAGGVQTGALVATPADNGVSCGGAGLSEVPLDGAVTILAP